MISQLEREEKLWTTEIQPQRGGRSGENCVAGPGYPRSRRLSGASVSSPRSSQRGSLKSSVTSQSGASAPPQPPTPLGIKSDVLKGPFTQPYRPAFPCCHIPLPRPLFSHPRFMFLHADRFLSFLWPEGCWPANLRPLILCSEAVSPTAFPCPSFYF